MITTAYLKGYSMHPLLTAIKRCVLKVRRHWLYSDLDYFYEQRRSGIAGLMETQRELINVESELRDLK